MTPEQQKIRDAIISGQATLIDVRSGAEFLEGHVAGAVPWPLIRLSVGDFPKQSKDRPLYLYCHSGNRAESARILLVNAGYQNVVNLGGIDDVEQLLT